MNGSEHDPTDSGGVARMGPNTDCYGDNNRENHHQLKGELDER